MPNMACSGSRKKLVSDEGEIELGLSELWSNAFHTLSRGTLDGFIEQLLAVKNEHGQRADMPLTDSQLQRLCSCTR